MTNYKQGITIVIPVKTKENIAFIEDFKKKEIKDIKILVIVGDNPSKNRNKGIDKAETELVAFVNSHSLLSNNWKEKVLEFFDNHPEIDAVGGPQLTPIDSDFFARVSDYAFSSKFGVGGVSKRYKKAELELDADETMLTSANLICRKRVFEKVKFDEGIYPGEDPKFISELKEKGYNIAYCPEIIVYNKKREGALSLIKQIYYYGLVRPRKESLLKTLKKPFFLVPSIFLLYLIILVPLMFFISSNLIRLILLSPIFVYLALNLIFSLYHTLKFKDITASFLLPFIYPIIHLSYGSGFLFSTLENIFKKRKNIQKEMSI